MTLALLAAESNNAVNILVMLSVFVPLVVDCGNRLATHSEFGARVCGGDTERVL